MNSDSVKGKIDDAAGRARRQVGEWTGNVEEQVKGATQQVKGKAEKVAGKLRDRVRDATQQIDRKTIEDKEFVDENRDREDITRTERE